MRSPGVISMRSTFHQSGRFMIILAALAMVMAMTGMTASWGEVAPDDSKVWICKTKGNPSSPTIKGGNNPIEVSESTLVDDGDGNFTFSDSHGSERGFIVDGKDDPACQAGGDVPVGKTIWVCDTSSEVAYEIDEEDLTDTQTEVAEGTTCDNGPTEIWVCDDNAETAYKIDEDDLTDAQTEVAEGTTCDNGDTEVNYVWICGGENVESVRVDAESLADEDEDAIVNGPGVVCDNGPGDNGPDDNGPDDNGPDDNGPDDNGPDDNGATEETEEFVIVLDDDHVRSPAAETTEVLSGGELPRTGTDSLTVFALALLMLAIGGSMITLGRRVESLN